jgi:hypothetical protein
MADIKRKTESMFQEFRILYESEISNDSLEVVFEVQEVDVHNDFDINEWRFRGGVVPKENELQRYLKSPLMNLGTSVAHNTFDILEWLQVNQREYSILSCIALDLYAVPGMSAEVERVFSGHLQLYFGY